MSGKKLNLGCGTDIREGWVNLDSVKLPGVTVVHNIEHLPLPFKDDEFDEILCQDVLEHVDYLPLLQDLHRILQSGGVLRIRVPHFTSVANFIDPTHKKLFSVRTFDFLVQNTRLEKKRPYYLPYRFQRLEDCTITFERSSRFFFYNRLVAKIVNHSPRMQALYEATGWSRLFPAQNILVTLVK
jgi:SAM-dependent methyltransferase